jgi:hypothetical protein
VAFAILIPKKVPRVDAFVEYDTSTFVPLSVSHFFLPFVETTATDGENSVATASKSSFLKRTVLRSVPEST